MHNFTAISYDHWGVKFHADRELPRISNPNYAALYFIITTKSCYSEVFSLFARVRLWPRPKIAFDLLVLSVGLRDPHCHFEILDKDFSTTPIKVPQPTPEKEVIN
jgi:hypothetical protein